MPLSKITTASISTAAATANTNIDNGTFFVDVTNNRVGVGSTTPQSPLEVYGLIRTTGFVSNPTSGAGMEMAYDGTQGILQAYSDRAAQTPVPVYLVTGQLRFPATQLASADANTLDDYEEGTWTPTLTFGGGSAGITYGSQLGTYVKIGKLVWLNCRLALSAKGSSTGSARVTGLPFTNQGGSSNGEIQVGAVWYNTWNNASNLHINLRQDASAAPNYMEFRAYSGGSEATVDQTYFNNSSSFSFTILSLVTA